MKSEFNAGAPRAALACAALFATLAVVFSIDLLSRHYGAQAQVTAAARAVVAIRAAPAGKEIRE